MYEYDYYQLEDEKMRGTLRDWRKALRTPATYRVGNTVRIQPQFVFLITLLGLCILLFFYYNWWTDSHSFEQNHWRNSVRQYNATYPLTTPIVIGEIVTFKICIVADLDTKSKSNNNVNQYFSYLKTGYLSYNSVRNTVSVTWDKHPASIITSTYSHNGRGMELSELIVYDGRLLTFDDRSGLVFEIIKGRLVPWVVLTDGSGQVDKGFKSEWATIKDQLLYVGSMGKEWTTAKGEFQNYNPMWLKVVNIYGEVQHLNWVSPFKSIRKSIGIDWPGYMIHESGAWSEIKQKWYFLPRRCCTEAYNETKDEVMGCNYLITADNNFKYVQALEITKRQPKLGFSSFKFIPGSKDEAIVALKTTEFEGNTASYITAFRTDGTTLLEDTFIENLKYEGLEFI